MSLTASTRDENGLVVIKIGNRFDFSVHKQFRDAYRETPGEGTRYCVDLSDTDYMESSALGMLLLLREHAGGDRGQVSLRNPSEPVRKVLEIANFHKLFQIE